MALSKRAFPEIENRVSKRVVSGAIPAPELREGCKGFEYESD